MTRLLPAWVRMNLKIKFFLFQAVLLASVLAAMAAVTGWNLERGFERYVTTADLDRLDWLAKQVEGIYADEGASWDFVRANPHVAWRRLYQPPAHLSGNEEGVLPNEKTSSLPGVQDGERPLVEPPEGVTVPNPVGAGDRPAPAQGAEHPPSSQSSPVPDFSPVRRNDGAKSGGAGAQAPGAGEANDKLKEGRGGAGGGVTLGSEGNTARPQADAPPRDDLPVAPPMIGLGRSPGANRGNVPVVPIGPRGGMIGAPVRPGPGGPPSGLRGTRPEEPQAPRPIPGGGGSWSPRGEFEGPIRAGFPTLIAEAHAEPAPRPSTLPGLAADRPDSGSTEPDAGGSILPEKETLSIAPRLGLLDGEGHYLAGNRHAPNAMARRPLHHRNGLIGYLTLEPANADSNTPENGFLNGQIQGVWLQAAALLLLALLLPIPWSRQLSRLKQVSSEGD